jgi:hypothetical protein
VAIQIFLIFLKSILKNLNFKINTAIEKMNTNRKEKKFKGKINDQ